MSDREQAPHGPTPRADRRATSPVAHVSVWNVANGLTGLRLVMVPLFGWLLLAGRGQTSWRMCAAAAFVVFGAVLIAQGLGVVSL